MRRNSKRNPALLPLGPSAPTLARLAIAALIGTAGCGTAGGPARYDGASVVYEGPPYGDFLTLADGVRQCMKSSKTALPRLILVDGIFECYTTVGWRQVYGCSGSNEVFLDAKVLLETQGSLWSHELTHYFGTKAEDDPCGNLAIEGFSIARPDAGGVAGGGPR